MYPALLEKVVSSIIKTMNHALQLPYTHDDVKKVLFSIIDMKARGMDGLHVVFF
jgi:hypothetical protein